MNYKTLSVILGVLVLALVGYVAYSNYTPTSQTESLSGSQLMQPEPTRSNDSSSTDTEQETPAIDSTTKSERATGTFKIATVSIVPNTVCFTTDQSGETFCFNNQPEAKALLKISSAGTLGQNGCEEIKGKATILFARSANGSRSLESVVQIHEPAKCGPIS